MKRIISIVLSMAFAVACNSFGKDVPKANPFNETLAAVPAAELPAKAADLVLKAKPRARKDVTVNVVKAAVGINPAAAPAIVGAIARAVPEMASVAAKAATIEQPKQASAIAKAAVAAAPSMAGEIQAVALSAAADQTPAVRVLQDQPGVTPGPGIVPMAKGPATGAPYIPISITPTNVTPGGSGIVPANGRNYATP